MKNLLATAFFEFVLLCSGAFLAISRGATVLNVIMTIVMLVFLFMLFLMCVGIFSVLY